VRPASEPERRRLAQTFVALCEIPSPSGEEDAVAAWLIAELGGMGLATAADASGNLLARLDGRSERSVLVCAHMDTVPHGDVPIEPICADGQWSNRNDAILGADNKAAVAVIVELLRRACIEGCPVGVEALFTVREEVGLRGAAAFDVGLLRSDLGYVFDHASPIGEVIVASPTYVRIEAEFLGAAAHAGIRPEDGRSAILAAAKAIAAMRLGRLDPETTANVGIVAGGTGRNVVPERCRLEAEARSLSEDTVEALVAEMVDHLHDAANDPACPCDLDVVVAREFTGYRQRTDAPGVAAAEAALRACGYTPRRVPTGGGSDANAFEVAGLHCTNMANGTERNHQPDERVSVAALEGMLDVVFALVDELAP
jgi:tripeptide aminopeptidase